MKDQALRITEIFYSLQGEARTVGLPTVFVRLTGCPLRCVYCDTAYAFEGGEIKSLSDILASVAAYQARYVTVTGGEPLAQQNCEALLSQLCDLGCEVSLETSGALAIEKVDPRVVIVMDLKTPSSGEEGRNRYANITHLHKKDQLKFVIGNRRDYQWAKSKIEEYELTDRLGDVLFSPAHDQQSATQLADWILEDRLLVRMQLQLHKLLWQGEAGH